MKTTNKLETIGTDVSLKECKREGYLMLSFPKGEKLDKSEYYNIFRYYPEYIIEESNGRIEPDEKIVDTAISWNYIYERYLQYSPCCRRWTFKKC